MKILTKMEMIELTDWSTTKKKVNFWKTKEDVEHEEREKPVTFSPSELAGELKTALRTAYREGNYAAVRAQVKAALDDSTNPENPGAGFSSPVNQGGLTYEQSHPNGTPVLSEDADFDAIRETTSSDGNQRKLRKQHAAFDGSNPLSKSAYSYPHHGGSGSQPLYPSAVRKIAAKLGLSDKPGQGIIPTKGQDNPLNTDAVVRGHIERHLKEINK